MDKLWTIGFKSGMDAHNNVLTATRNARLLVLLGRQADEQTRRIVKLTWALVILTVALFFLTAYLSYDTYLKSKGYETKQSDNSKKL